MPSEIKLANLNNIGVVVEPPLLDHTVHEGHNQTLARLLGWNYLEERFDFIHTDTDGRLLVSTDPTKSEEAQHSAATVGLVSGVVLPKYTGRRGLILQNISPNTIYIVFGLTATVAVGLELRTGVSLSDEIYVGAVSAISLIAGSDMRILEYR